MWPFTYNTDLMIARILTLIGTPKRKGETIMGAIEDLTTIVNQLQNDWNTKATAIVTEIANLEAAIASQDMSQVEAAVTNLKQLDLSINSFDTTPA
jgi:hypothetical protein